MNQITWDMRYGLPNQTYLEFVARYLLQQVSGRSLVDPFALDVPTDKVGDVYVVREDVEGEICQPGTVIITGLEGSGKTTLFRKLPVLLRGQALIVRLPLTQVGASVPEQELMDGKVSLLTPQLVVHYIFDAYWECLLREPVSRAEFLPQLRQDQGWMARLRWFYQHCPLIHPEIPGDFELVTWLNASPSREPFGPKIAPEDMLRELIRFVTSATPRQERFGAPSPRPYVQVQVLIDGTEYLSNQAITRLVQDAQRLYDLCLDAQFKLFADSAWQKPLGAMDCVRQGRVKVYRLPCWDKEELRQILYLRLKAWRQGEPAEAEYDWEYDWGRLIPEAHLEHAAQAQFVNTIIRKAMKVYEKEDDSAPSYDLDAPIHLLRLARGLIGACAGCWKEQGYVPPLNLSDIEKLTNLYWNTEQEEKDAHFSES